MLNIFKCLFILINLWWDNRLVIQGCRVVYLEGRRGNAIHYYEHDVHFIFFKIGSIPKMMEYIVHELVHVLQQETGLVNPVSLPRIPSLDAKAHAFTYTYSEDDQYHEFFAQYAALYVTCFANR